jgi:hypothetical protein
MNKQQPTWKCHRQQTRVLTGQAVVYLSRAPHAGAPPSGHQVAVNRLLDEFRQTGEYQALQGLLSSVSESDRSLAVEQQNLADLEIQLTVDLTSGNDPAATEAAIRESKANLETIERRRQHAVNAIPEAREDAARAYAVTVSMASAEQMADAKPRVEEIIGRIDQVLSPLLDALFGAQRALAEASSAGMPDVETVLASSAAYGGIRAPAQSGDGKRVLVDNRIDYGPIVGPSQQRPTHDPMPYGPSSPKHGDFQMQPIGASGS